MYVMLHVCEVLKEARRGHQIAHLYSQHSGDKFETSMVYTEVLGQLGCHSKTVSTTTTTNPITYI